MRTRRRRRHLVVAVRPASDVREEKSGTREVRRRRLNSLSLDG